MKSKLIQFISLVLVMLVTGVFWGTWFTLTRTIENFSLECFLAIGKTIISNVKTPMQILMPTTLIALITLTILSFPFKARFWLSLIALLLMILTLLITVGIEVPIDNQIKTWSIGHTPSNWEALRDKWQFFHFIRTLTSIMSFIFLCSAILIHNKSEQWIEN